MSDYRFFKVTEINIVKYCYNEFLKLEQIREDVKGLSDEMDLSFAQKRTKHPNHLILVGFALLCETDDPEKECGDDYIFKQMHKDNLMIVMPAPNNLDFWHSIPVKYLYLLEENPLYDYTKMAQLLSGHDDFIIGGAMTIVNKDNVPEFFFSGKEIPDTMPITSVEISEAEFNKMIALNKRQVKQNKEVKFP